MRRLLTITLIASLLSIGAPLNAHGKPAIPCDGRRVRQTVPRLGTAEVQHRVKLAIACAVHRFPVAGGYARAVCIGSREGGLWPWSKNPYSTSWGTFQVIDTTWASWFANYDLVRRWIKRAYHGDPAQIRLDPYAGVILPIRAMHDSETPWAGGSYVC